MKYITELDTDRIKKIAGKLPNNSAIINLDDRVFALNVSSALWEANLDGASLTLSSLKDKAGKYAVQVDRNVAARRLYEIAEPDGDWRLISWRDREKYIRMQDAGVKP